jgi:hypothetical protein
MRRRRKGKMGMKEKVTGGRTMEASDIRERMKVTMLAQMMKCLPV